MTSALVPLDLTQLPSTSIGSSEIFDELAKGGEFLQRLQLFGKGKHVDKGLIPPGHYGIFVSNEEIIDLGKKIDIIPFARRPKALDTGSKPPISVYDENSEEFKRIAAKSQVKNSGCQFGPSFLVIERSTGKFLEFFLGAPTHRPEAKKIYPALPLSAADIESRKLKGEEPHGPLPITLTQKYIEKEFSWYVPVVLECSTPFTKLPSIATINAEIAKFLNPPASEVEEVEEEEKPAKKARKR